MTGLPMTNLHFQHTALLDWSLDAPPSYRLLVHEGGSGSSKTFSLAQLFIVLSFQEEGKLYTVVRDRLPALRRSAMRDFQHVLSETGAYSFFDENKSERLYTNRLTGTQIEFAAFDTPQKARGPRRDRLWGNEANELTREVFRQLAMRTRSGICLDYNPSMQRHWIYDEVLPRADCLHLRSTFRDNPFLSAEEVREIKQAVPVYEEADGTRITDWDLGYDGDGHLISGDPYHWAVFGLGRRGAPSEAIYPTCDVGAFPEEADAVLGLDFGYNHPAVLCRLALVDGRPPALHVDELVHTSHLTTEDLIELLPGCGVSTDDLIYADGSRPDTIEAMARAGYNVQAADRRQGSVYAGIQFVKQHRLVFTERSERSRTQCMDYRWKKHRDGRVLDEPVKLNDDAPDAIRYAAYTHWGAPTPEMDYSNVAAA